MGPEEMRTVAGYIARAIEGRDDETALATPPPRGRGVRGRLPGAGDH